MRQIGTLPNTTDARALGDHLLAIGVTSRAVKSPDGWAIWVHSEDLVEKAREEFAAYRQNPDDPRFHSAASAAAEVRKHSEQLDRAYRKNVKSVSAAWQGVRFRRRPLTIILVAVCIVLFLVGGFVEGGNAWLRDHLGFFSTATLRHGADLSHGLDDVAKHGQVWRLVTPIFLHVNLIHLAFNVWALYIIGTIIETRRGPLVFLMLVFVSAVVSNIGQYLYVVNFSQVLQGWVGISGVVYALFGYLWMKGVVEPEDGMILHPSTVRTMLLWLLLGFTNFIPMANGAHVMGLVAGILFGLARF